MTCLVRCELFFYITGATIIYSIHEQDLTLPWLLDVNCTCGNSHISLPIFPGYFDYLS